MNQIKEYNNTIFESIKHVNKDGDEYWLARELMVALEYSKWSNFAGVIDKAKSACKLSNNNIDDHFDDVGKTIDMPKGATKTIDDYELSRYACYLIAQNGDSRKESIALAQTYFAIQTRKQEISQIEYSQLSEDEKRFYQRSLTKKGNYSLNHAAKNGATMPEELPTPKKSLKELEKEKRIQEKIEMKF